MKKPKFDNPWLGPFLFVYLPVCGFILGWIFGPIFTPGAAHIPDTDTYSWGLRPSVIAACIGLVAGIIVAACIVIQLIRQANIPIPEDTLEYDLGD